VGNKKVLILGGTGMIGHVLFTKLSLNTSLDVYATARSPVGLEKWFPATVLKKIRVNVDANDFDTIIRALASIEPDIVINCIGLIKQLPLGDDPLSAITVNSQMPHRLSLICRTAGAKLIHMSTDCVFQGTKGQYLESDPSDCTDLYGRTKYLGEVSYPHCITLRTSLIGHELKGNYGLTEWFLAQQGKVRGFTKAIFSGLPTIELARVINDYILPNPELHGIYHISSKPISKYDLLNLIHLTYKNDIEIERYNDFMIDRSLDSAKFRQATGYVAPDWSDLVDIMHQDYLKSMYSRKV
jgi:dTDP-4-dehydrorhamnose reductase